MSKFDIKHRYDSNRVLFSANLDASLDSASAGIARFCVGIAVGVLVLAYAAGVQ